MSEVARTAEALGVTKVSGVAGAVALCRDEPYGSSSSESSITTSGADGTGWVDSSTSDPGVTTPSTLAPSSEDAGARAAGIIASGEVAAGAGVSWGGGEVGDEGIDGEGDGVLPDNAAVVDWPGEHASSMHGTLSGRLRPVVFFLISTTKIWGWRLWIRIERA
jgi:hypothetical protein